MSAPLNLVIVDDYEVVVRGVATMLAPFADRVRVLEVAAGTLPTQDCDIALYDTFGARTGVAVDCATALSDYRADHLVIYTWDVEAALANPVLQNAASGFISKAVSAEQLVERLEQVHAGEVLQVTEGVSPDEAKGDWPGRSEGLSERESEILALIVQGLANQDVADRAFLSINTVKSYIRSAYRKMGVTTRSQALLWGLDHGFRPDSARTSPDAERP